MMQWRHSKNAAAAARLEVRDLQHHRDGFDDEHTAHDEQHDLLACNHRDRAERAAERERADIAHEYFGRVRVEPQKREPGAGDRGADDHQLTRAGDVRKQQIAGEVRAPDDVGKDPECGTDHYRRHDRQPVQSIGQVHRVAGADDHQVRQQDETEYAKRVRDVLEERHQQIGARRQVDVEPLRDPLMHQVPDAIGRWCRDRKREVERRCQPDRRLPRVFFARAHAFRVSVHDLPIVVDPSDQPEAERDDQRDPDEAVRQIGPQQRRDTDRDQNQRAAHRRRAGLGQMRLRAILPHRLADFQCSEAADDPRSGRQADQHRGCRGEHRSQRQVREDVE